MRSLHAWHLPAKARPEEWKIHHPPVACPSAKYAPLPARRCLPAQILCSHAPLRGVQYRQGLFPSRSVRQNAPLRLQRYRHPATVPPAIPHPIQYPRPAANSPADMLQTQIQVLLPLRHPAGHENLCQVPSRKYLPNAKVRHPALKPYRDLHLFAEQK